MDIYNITLEDYRKMEKPAVKLESIINFETLKEGSPIGINPDNTGFKKQAWAQNAIKRKLEFLSINESGVVRCYDESGYLLYYNYKNLIIL